MIKTVFLDLDDTILDFHKAESVALRKALTELGLPATDEVVARYSAINDWHWKQMELGKMNRHQVLTGRFAVLFEEFGVVCDSELAKATYEKYLSQGHFFLPGAVELLEALAPRYDLYLASNGTTVVQKGRIASAGIAHYFKSIFLSQEIGFNKPSRAYFDACIAAIPSFRQEDAIIIGDSLTSDIRGGNNAGIRTCWFNPHGKGRIDGIHVDYEVSTLEEIPPLLDSLNT